MLFTIVCIAWQLNNSRKLGLALFALGIIIFFSQETVLGYIHMIASIFISPEAGFYQVISQSYYVIFALSLFSIIAGIVMFYRDHKESDRRASSASTEK